MPLPRDPNQTPQPSKLPSVEADEAEGPGTMMYLEVAWNRCMTDDRGCRDNDGRQVRSNVTDRNSLVRFAAFGVLRAPLVWYDHLGWMLPLAVVMERNEKSLESENEQTQGPWEAEENTAVSLVLSDPGSDNSLVLEFAVEVAGNWAGVGLVYLDMNEKQGW